MRAYRGWLLLSLCLVASPAAAIPPVLSQEGLVLNAEGDPIEGRVQIRFSIYDRAADGNALWFEDHDLVLLQGYYQAHLGLRQPVAASLNGNDRYLGIAINGAAELRPRTRLVSVPYAFIADNATGNITPASVRIANGGSVSIGGNVVIDANGRWRGQPIDAGNIVGQVGDASTFDGHGIDEFIVITQDDAPGKLQALLDRVANIDADTLDGIDSSRFLRYDNGVNDAARQVLVWLQRNGDPVPINATRLDGLDSTDFVRAGQPINADTLDGIDSAAFLRVNGKAADSDRLDGLDSTDFVRAGAGLNADRLDNVDSSQFMRADANTGTTGSVTVNQNLGVQGTTNLGQVRVAGGARVGVGVANPEHEVHVAGTVKADRFIGAMVIGGFDRAPANPVAGQVYFNTVDKTFEGWTGDRWVKFNPPNVGGSPESAGRSCQDILDRGGSRGNGRYWIRPGNAPQALEVFCDMTTDGGGYTMVRFNDGGLGGDQNQYRNYCAARGMEVIVPRTRAHAVAIRAWNNGEVPNLVNVFPKNNGASGLSNWTGRCQGQPCSFWMSDTNSANPCAHLEPNGDNNTEMAIYRWNACNDSPFGGWNDAHNNIDFRGWVVCSTNDKTFPVDGTSCLDIHQRGRSRGNGQYSVQPAGAREPVQVYCDMTTDGGGYTMVRFNDGALGGDQNQYRAYCAARGMEVIVPRTRNHALAIRAWNNGEVPNLVNVFPRFNGASGLNNWTGRCRGQACGFWMSDNNSANPCAHLEPNGDNNTEMAIYRWNACNDSPFGGWNDAHNNIDFRGTVICSTNDK